MPAPLTITCSGCGAAVPAGDRFCGTCGNPITGSAVLSGEGAAPFDPWVELLQKLRQATLGEYDIKGELGRGGMAAVFLAHDLHLNRKVAIKVMLPGLVYSERMWERFLAEARTAAKLDHPNIIYIHSVKEKDRFMYFVMKYVDGRPLDDLLSRGPLPLRVAQTILVEIARGLDYAHREGIVHRDIKPANIMIDHTGSAIVTDFGIARVQDSAHFTQTGATIGTPAYMSPEQCHGYDVTAASDQYSLGVVAYEMFAGKPPFVGSPIELQLAHIQDEPKPISDVRKDLPRELADAVMRMLHKEPTTRFASLHEVVRQLSHCCDTSDPAIREEIVKIVKSGPPRRHSFQPTPVSPAPMANRPRAPEPASPTPVRPPALTPLPDDDTVRSAETAAVGAITADDARSRPTAAIDSGQHDAATLIARVSDGHSGTTVETPAPRNRTPVLIGIGVVALAGIAFAISTSGDGPKANPTAADSSVTEVPVTAAATVDAALGDSVVVGHGPDAAATVRGKALRSVGADAIAMFNVSLGARRLGVGDTVRARLDALDDAGEKVTSPQIVWSTSNPRIVKFAGPGMLVGVREGSATITVAAAATTGKLQVTIGAPSAPTTKAKSR
ncbi:MAG: protein kinase [Gemmatimonadota bacterium]|nr:protein kinase [Gemmatimonadota bacterium]